jgi:beta-lactamase class A
MPVMLRRRDILVAVVATLAALAAGVQAAPSMTDIGARLAEIEKSTGGRLGVAILDTKSGELYGQRLLERFPLCSTFKALAAGLVLVRVDGGEEKLDRRVTFGKDDVVPYSPVSKARAGSDGMTMAEICQAAVTQSDNTASNLMLNSFGGPEALTDWLRTLGDKATRLDRAEPAVNDVPAGDPRDGTTPRAMAYTLQRVLLGNVLSKASEKQLADWMIATKTGDARLRAGLPAGWRIGDKTGTCNGSASDVAIIWPPDRPPLIVAAYLADAKVPAKEREAALARVGQAVAESIGPQAAR